MKKNLIFQVIPQKLKLNFEYQILFLKYCANRSLYISNSGSLKQYYCKKCLTQKVPYNPDQLCPSAAGLSTLVPLLMSNKTDYIVQIALKLICVDIAFGWF